MDIKDRRALTPDRLRKEIDARIDSPVSLHDWLRDFLPWIVGPSITSFTPTSGRPGSRVDIDGARFSTTREDNTVEVGNRPALVVAATANRLTVVTDAEVTDGPVKVTVGGKTAVGPQDFSVLGYPDPLAGEDGPPIAFSGAGPGSAGDVNPIGRSACSSPWSARTTSRLATPPRHAKRSSTHGMTSGPSTRRPATRGPTSRST